MDIREMQKSFLQQFQVMDHEVQISTIKSEDIETYINKSIDQFIKNKFELRNNRQQLGFEQSQIRIDELKSLIKESDPLDTTTLSVPFEENVFIDKADFPEDYRHLIKVSALVQYNNTGVEFTTSNDKRSITGVENTDYKERKVNCKFVQLDDIQQIVADPFNKMRIKTPIYTINGDSVYVYTDETFIVDKIYLTYIKEPNKVSLEDNVDCNLSTSTHEDIVDLAVSLLAQDRGLKQPQGESQN